MTSNVSIRGEGASIAIEIAGYERPSAEDVYDANWLKCRIEVRVGSFSGLYPASLTTDYIQELSEQLRACLDGPPAEATITSEEGGLDLTIKIDVRGSVSVTGIARPLGPPEAQLRFGFESSMTYLKQTARELAQALEQYPVREVSSAHPELR